MLHNIRSLNVNVFAHNRISVTRASWKTLLYVARPPIRVVITIHDHFTVHTTLPLKHFLTDIMQGKRDR